MFDSANRYQQRKSTLNTKQSILYVDGMPGPTLREARKVMGWVNMVNGIQTLFSW
jgi:hypothetical protein